MCPRPWKNDPSNFPQTHASGEFFSKSRQTFPLCLVTRILRTKYRREKENATPLFSTTRSSFRNPGIGIANYSQIAYDIHLYRKKREGKITKVILQYYNRFQPFTPLFSHTPLPFQPTFHAQRRANVKKEENIRVTILTASLHILNK